MDPRIVCSSSGYSRISTAGLSHHEHRHDSPPRSAFSGGVGDQPPSFRHTRIGIRNSFFGASVTVHATRMVRCGSSYSVIVTRLGWSSSRCPRAAHWQYTVPAAFAPVQRWCAPCRQHAGQLLCSTTRSVVGSRVSVVCDMRDGRSSARRVCQQPRERGAQLASRSSNRTPNLAAVSFAHRLHSGASATTCAAQRRDGSRASASVSLSTRQ